MDLEMTMWLEDETASSEIARYLMSEMVNAELFCELYERVLRSYDDFPSFV
jgi:hypothetical protein